MNNKKIIKKKTINRKANIYEDGAFMKFMGNPVDALKGGIGAIGSTVGGLAGNAISNGLDSKAGNIISGLGDVASAIPGPWGAVASAGLKVIGGLTNAAFGMNTNQEALNSAKQGTSYLQNFTSTAQSFDDIQGPMNVSPVQDVYRGGWFTKDEAAEKNAQLRRERSAAQDFANRSVENNIQNIKADQMGDLMANYASYGGLLDNIYKSGGNIYIKPSKRGTFTAEAKKHNKSVQEFANQVLANKDEYSTSMIKKANFAKNAAKWKHAFGGTLSTQGADFNNGITIIGNGGTHEDNKYEGVQIGVDPQGIPNLVEEGEVIFNDYVFSNRIKVPKSVKKKYKIKGNKDLTFAEAAKYIQKESEERPNDPISQRGLEVGLMKLAKEQESKRVERNSSNKFDSGGTKYGIKLPPLYNTPEDVYDLGELETPELVEITNPKFKGFGTNEYERKTLTRSLGVDQNNNNNNNSSTISSMLRYAPAVGSALQLAHNLANKPDYSNADRLMQEAENVGIYSPVSSKTISNYLTYNPFDRNYYQNKLNAEAGATRRAIMNTNSPSRNAALLAADYNAQGRLGDLARQAEEYNLAQRQAVAQFNRGTNQANAEMSLKASMSNAELAQKAKQARLAGVQNALAMREAVDANRSASINSSFNNLIENLGAIGTDILNREDALKVASSLYKCGGKMKKKRRGGLTY